MNTPNATATTGPSEQLHLQTRLTQPVTQLIGGRNFVRMQSSSPASETGASAPPDRNTSRLRDRMVGAWISGALGRSPGSVSRSTT